MSVPTDQDDRPNKSIPPVKESKYVVEMIFPLLSSFFLTLSFPSRRKAKPWDHPKRPLSAYNFFFQAERKAIVAAVDEAQKRKKKMGKSDAKDAPAKAEENPVKSEPTTEYTYILDDETLERLLTPDGKISFEQIGKLIGQNWKKVDPVRLAKYTEMAKQDRRRYKQEMDAFNLRHHARELRKQEQEYGRNPSVGVPFRPAKMARAGEANRNIGYSYPAGMPGASAFSHVIQPARSFDSYENYPYAMSHQFPMYYPPNYPGYGMAPSQESRFASLPGPPSVSQYPTYGREAYASSGAYRGTMGGGGYSYG